jgi:hypothetical protein
MSRARVLVSVGLVGLALATAGCSRKSDASAPGDGQPAARIVATADFGADELLTARVAPGGSVMDDLRSVTAVETAYGGGFVASMLGRGTETAPAADWFFYVNGIESPVGAGDVTLTDGEVAWWDHHHWQGAMSIRGVVGSWPEPFVHVATTVQADAPLAATLRAAGASVVAGSSTFRVLVGTDATLSSRDTTWRSIDGDPGGHHLAGGIANGAVVLIPPGGGPPVPVTAASAVAVLVPVGAKAADGAVFAVAGLTPAAASAAAATIARDPAVLAQRFAVAFNATGVPVQSAGRPEA